MSHIIFFSYARENDDPYLKDFFKDLRGEIAPATKWAADDEGISFRDKSNLRLMENWSDDIENALQSSAVLVCITSVAYLNKEFCGKEYYIFDQRRRQGLPEGKAPPPVVLPVIWAPVDGGLPNFMNEAQQVPKNFPDSYRIEGLRKFARFDRDNYNRCVSAFADAIVDAWRKHGKILPLANMTDFANIPNAFAGGEWQEAAGPGGWLAGPEVASFVFVAESKDECPVPEGRYGGSAGEWRPYLPPEPTTILDHARSAAKKQFRFREIRVGENLRAELAGAKNRKNLTIVVGDPKALPLDTFKSVRAIEDFWWEGSALLLPSDETVVKWDDQDLQKSFKTAFPVISQMTSPNVRGPLRSSDELKTALDRTLCEMRKAVTQPEIDNREKSDPPPPGLTGSAGSRT